MHLGKKDKFSKELAGFAHLYSNELFLGQKVEAQIIQRTGRITEKVKGSLEPCALTYFMMPLFNFLHFILVNPCKFEFDPDLQGFKIISGTKFRKFLSGFILVVTMLHDRSGSNLEVAEVHQTIILVMLRIRGYIYMCYSITYFYTLIAHGEKIRDILSDIHCLSIQINSMDPKRTKDGTERKNRKNIFKVRLFSTVLTIAFVVKGFHYITTLIGPNTPSGYYDLVKSSDPATDVSENWMNFISDIADNGYRQMFGGLFMKDLEELKTYKFSKAHSKPVTIFWGFMYFYIGFMHGLTWLTGFLMQTLWSLLFWRLLVLYFQVIEADKIQSISRCMMRDTGQFLGIASVIEKYNSTTGAMTLLGTLTGIFHFSFESMKIFGIKENVHEFTAIFTMLIIFGAMLLSATQVNLTGTRIASVIKERFQETKTWGRYYGKNYELSQGIFLIFHLLHENKIGIRAFGFFTISYSFIGSVIGVICTYAVLNIQQQHA